MSGNTERDAFVIATLFPSILNTNGDAANARVLAQRARWSEVANVSLVEVEHAEQMPRDVDFVVVGACSEPDVVRAHELLVTVQPALEAAGTAGVPVLAVGTGWYLLSQRFLTPGRSSEAGLGLFSGSASTRSQRISDDLVVDTAHGQLVGYENHSTDYRLGQGEKPLGTVAYGSGNGDGTEGALTGSLVGTHLHGPILARNPSFADHLLSRALERTGRTLTLSARAQEADRFAANARSAVTAALGL